ncbi:hypothetical protein [Synechococcus sp. FACHB-909]|uniref:hypothetical protein n=1 Tax=Synechococcus sp. FACHB-909 TaxID=2692863 RepID=UPI0016833423|nr:hypothetical protein [Synechococcus sp. FACHB-909]MBD2718106.1 hypothetical protein [Synechococcus sp. FACHB-909]
MSVADQYEMSRDGLRRLHKDIQEHGELEIGMRCGHAPAMARRAAHYRLRELMRELGIHDLDAIPAP